MNYAGKRIAITGADGFLGAALVNRLLQLKAEVIVLDGDVRNYSTFERLDHTYDYLFHFGAPSSQVLFKRNASYCIETTLKGLMNAAQACQWHGIRLIFPSTGLLSSDRYNEYAMCKKISEDYVRGMGINALALRIFATYGPGEGHKADYASVPYLFARDILEGRKPVIFGTGAQVRDFIYIDDVVEAIVHLAEECYDPVIDIGSGERTSFNDILAGVESARNELLPDEAEEVEAVYIDQPGGYVMQTTADPSRLHDFYVPAVSFKAGIKKLVAHLAER